MQKGLIGVIVPVYKVEKYIAECIESILAQTYTKFRLILVDDGTPDNAGKICDEYAKKDSRITVIHQQNAGVTRARARGVEEADDCEFIMFVDSDDTLNIDSVYTLLKAMKDFVDIVVGIDNSDNIQSNAMVLENEEYIRGLIRFTSYLPQAIWGKLFRRKIFNKHIFDITENIVIGEDVIANIRLATNSTKPVVFLNKVIYNYRILPESAYHSFKNSLPYQVEFFRHLKESVPKEKLSSFLPDIVKREILEWGNFYKYSAKNNDRQDLAFIAMLKSDINKCNYEVDFFVKVQLYCKYKVVRYLFILIHKIKNYLHL